MSARRRRRSRGGGDSFGTSIADILTTALGCVLLLFLIALTQMKGAIRAERLALEGARQRLLEVSERRDELLQEGADKDEQTRALQAALLQQEQQLEEQSNTLAEQQARIASLEGRLSNFEDQRVAVQGELSAVSEALSTGLSAQPIDVMIVIDGTSSMEPSLNAVRQNLRLTIRALRIVSPESRVGITVFRDRRERPELRLQSEALTTEEDRLLEFLSSIEAMSTRLDRDRAEWLCGGIKRAMEARWSDRARRLMVLVSDADGQDRGTPGCVSLARRFHRDGGQVIMISTKPPNLRRRSVRRTYEQIVLRQHAEIAAAGGGEHIREAGPERLLEELLRAAFQARANDAARERRSLRERVDRARRGFTGADRSGETRAP